MTTAPLPLSSTHAGIGRELIQLPQERRIKLLALVCLIFFTTCGGAFGLEPLIGAVGASWAAILIVVTPLVWSLPTALMVAELTSLMPEEGGYYVWIRESFGSFWAVQQACWTMALSSVWLAMFPVLFVSYLAFLIPELTMSAAATHPGQGALLRWLVAVLVVVAGMGLNLRGSKEVGRSAKVSACFVLGAFALLLLVWLKRGPAPGAIVEIFGHDIASIHKGALLLGLSYAIFNFSNWEDASTYAGEVDQPQRNYPRALAMALLVMVLCYLVPVLAGISVTTDPMIWNSDAGWPVISKLIGGRWLGNLIAVAGLVSTFGLFNAQLLYISRLPYVMASDGWLPKVFAKVSHDTAAPQLAILCFCAIAALFAALSFGSLAIIQCILYAAALTLEFLSLIVLRIRRPEVHRNFRVPGGWWGMAYVCVTPFTFVVLVLFATLRDWESFPGQLVVVGVVALSGLVLYFVRRRAATLRSGEGFEPLENSPSALD